MATTKSEEKEVKIETEKRPKEGREHIIKINDPFRAIEDKHGSKESNIYKYRHPIFIIMNETQNGKQSDKQPKSKIQKPTNTNGKTMDSGVKKSETEFNDPFKHIRPDIGDSTKLYSFK